MWLKMFRFAGWLRALSVRKYSKLLEYRMTVLQGLRKDIDDRIGEVQQDTRAFAIEAGLVKEIEDYEENN